MRPNGPKLIDACKKGDIDTAKRLLQQGANPNCQDDQWPNPTALLIAAQNGHLSIINLLVQYGAFLHITDQYDQTALHYAIEKQRLDIAQHLITELKLDPNTQDRRGRTPFMIAAETGDIDMLQRLIQLGADPHIIDKDGRTALHYATKNREHPIIEYLMTQIQLDPNAKARWDVTPFMLAIQNGNINILKHLIRLGADPHLKDSWGQNALHFAAQHCHRQIIPYLIIHLDLDPNTQDRRGRTPLMIAAEKGDINMIELLIQLGANPYLKDSLGQTALHYAAEYNSAKTVSFLIAHLQLDPNTPNRYGETPLFRALQNGQDHAAQTLIQLGAQPDIPNHKGKTPAMIAPKRFVKLYQQRVSTITL